MQCVPFQNYAQIERPALACLTSMPIEYIEFLPGKSVYRLLTFVLLSLRGRVTFCSRPGGRVYFLLSSRGRVYLFLLSSRGARLIFCCRCGGAFICLLSSPGAPGGASIFCRRRGGAFFFAVVPGDTFIFCCRRGGVDFLLSLRESGFTHSLASWVRATTTKNNIKQLQQKHKHGFCVCPRFPIHGGRAELQDSRAS